ncbi:MAG: type II secretion system protein [Candidatus Levybacteria bacterium]|nr:type II secretion system protein [Candidatus Levybacteria bacterium]
MKLSPARHLQKGFTLIELLVVIGILGILAAALVATIDPFEQLRKARDSRTQNIAVELHGALVRYYTTHEKMPWETGSGASAACIAVGTAGTADDLEVGQTVLGLLPCLEDLIAEGELKQAFTTAQGLDEIYVIEPYCTGSTCAGGDLAVDGSPSICYNPESLSGRADDNNRYNRSGWIDVACTPGALAASCHWCAQ